MCGIAGFWALNGNQNYYLNAIKEMAVALNHRGPDNTGYWNDLNQSLFLAHNRLSILDLSLEGNQPMKSQSGRYVITFNGEIYNHKELKIELERHEKSLKLRGHSDTEVLLEVISKFGLENALKKCVGMFAMAIWDNQKKCLYLARDRMGEKPIYYGFSGSGNNQTFLFASELAAIRKWKPFENKINLEALSQLLNYQVILAPNSIFEGIFQLLPGHYLTINVPRKESLPDSKPWWKLNKVIENSLKNKIHNESEGLSTLEDILKKVVSLQSIADVPIGTFLSGGIDSSLITALLQTQSSQRIKTYTIGFEEQNYNEAPYSKEIAKHLNTEHTEFYLTSKDAIELIPDLSKIYTEPFADSSQLPTHLVCRESRNSGLKVALTGDGGDELFGGYNRYILGEKIWKRIDQFPWQIRRFLGAIGTRLPHNKLDEISDLFGQNLVGTKIAKLSKRLKYVRNQDQFYYSLISQWDDPRNIINENVSKEFFFNMDSLIQGNLPEEISNNLASKMMFFDSLSYLPNDILTKVDRASMATSLETRAPFLDHRVIETAWRLDLNLKINSQKSSNASKFILRKILYKYVPSNLIERPKAGFAIPLSVWLRGPLKLWAEDLISYENISKAGFLNPNKISSLWEEHLSFKKDNSSKLWPVLMFQSWLDNNYL